MGYRSWTTVFTILSRPEHELRKGSLESFLNDEHTTKLLQLPFHAFPAPSPESRARYETKTAAINVPPSTQGQYNLGQIKDDAIWLSKEVRLDEVAALRLVVLEWQSRPASELLGNLSTEEATSLQAAVGNTGLGSLGPVVNTSTSSAPTNDDSSFSSDSRRRLRLVELYLSERCHLLKVIEQLLSAAVGSRNVGKDQSLSDWIENRGTQLMETQRSRKPPDETFLALCINALSEKFQKLDGRIGWLANDPMEDIVEEIRAVSMTEEVVLLMQIILMHVVDTSEITSSHIVLSWLQLMEKYGFFDQFNPPFAGQKVLILPFRSLIAVISLAILKPSETLDRIQGDDLPSVESPSQPNQASEPNTAYFLDRQKIKDINELLFLAADRLVAIMSPAILAWGFILRTMEIRAEKYSSNRDDRLTQRAIESSGDTESQHRRGSFSSSASSSQSSIWEELLNIVQDQPNINVIQLFVKSALDGSHVLDVISSLAAEFCKAFPGVLGSSSRCILLELVRIAFLLVDYIPEVLAPTFEILNVAQLSGLRTVPSAFDPRTYFLSDQQLMEMIFWAAQARFPYEAVPFLKLCENLAGLEMVDTSGNPLLALESLMLQSLTQVVHEQVVRYELLDETEDNALNIRLREPLDIFSPARSSRTNVNQPPSNALVSAGSSITLMPAGTLGRAISDVKPAVVMFPSNTSLPAFLGKWLEVLSKSSTKNDAAVKAESNEEIMLCVINVFNAWLASVNDSSRVRAPGLDPVECAQRLLEEASDDIERNGDIVSVVFEIFENQLNLARSRSGMDRDLDLLNAGLRFFEGLTFVVPGRVWPLLARSRLLDINGRGGGLGTIIASVEITSGTYECLSTCTKLYKHLVEDAIRRSVQRKKSEISKALNRFATQEDPISNAPSHIIEKVLLAFTQTMAEVFQSYGSWRFNSVDQRLQINTDISSTFERLFSYTFRSGEGVELKSRLAGVFAPSATYLAEFFLSPTPNDFSLKSVLQTLTSGVTTPLSPIYEQSSFLWIQQVCSTLELCHTLVRLRKSLELPASRLEQQLLRASPILVRLFTVHPSYCAPVIALLKALVEQTSPNEADPPSLLAHLGSKSAQLFLNILRKFDKPLHDVGLDISIWSFLSAVVSNRQQWFSIFLLTGSSPRDTVRREKQKEKSESSEGISQTRGKKFLSVALDALSDIETLLPQRALAMIEFVELAEENWPWAMTDMIDHPKFVTAILDYLASLEGQDFSKPASTEEEQTNAYKMRIASFITNLLALCLHHANESEDVNFASNLIPKLGYLVDNGAAILTYNVSLHSNLKQNFEKKFNGCQLSDFQRTSLWDRTYGSNYYYDVELADKVLGFDKSWSGLSAREESFKAGLEKANTDLSAVDAQVVSSRLSPEADCH